MFKLSFVSPEKRAILYTKRQRAIQAIRYPPA